MKKAVPIRRAASRKAKPRTESEKLRYNGLQFPFDDSLNGEVLAEFAADMKALAK